MHDTLFIPMSRFPDHDDYVLVCHELVSVFPFLEDKKRYGRKNCSRYVSHNL